MLIAIFATLALAIADAPRLLPDPPKVPSRWEETGNRRARRRDLTLMRQ
jgi:hypothetical protein